MSDMPTLTTRLEVAKEQCYLIQAAVDSLIAARGISGRIAGDEYSKGGLNFGLSAAVYQWARGVSFKEITDMTEVQEGEFVWEIVTICVVICMFILSRRRYCAMCLSTR